MAEKEKQKIKKRENIFTLRIIHKHHKIIKEILVAVVALFTLGVMIVAARQYSVLKRTENAPVPQVTLPQQAPQEETILDPPTVDTADWQSYRNQNYGFELKYPSEWKKPTVKASPNGAKWQYRYLFRKNETDENSPYIGFDVVIYNVQKVKEISDTDEFPELKNQEQEPNSACALIEGHLFENPNYPAEEIYIPPNDDCYNTVFFYSLTRDEYIYNFIPVMKDGADKPDNPKKEVIKDFPEFFGVASSINLTDIVRPKPKPPTPKITAPQPVSAIRVNGRLVCAKKNDRPSYSDKTSHKHLDMECCLDPDEYPNPWCYYSPDKYGKYL